MAIAEKHFSKTNKKEVVGHYIWEKRKDSRYGFGPSKVYIGGVVTEKNANALVDYVHEIYEWNRLKRPLNADLEEKIQHHWAKTAKLNQWLSKRGVLPASSNTTIKDLLDNWRKSVNPREGTYQLKWKVWKKIFDKYGEGFPAASVTSEWYSSIVDELSDGDWSKDTRVVRVRDENGKCIKGEDGKYLKQLKNAGKKVAGSTVGLRIDCVQAVLKRAIEDGLVSSLLVFKENYSFVKNCRNVREKTYITVDYFNKLYDALSFAPDYQLGITYARVLGPRPNEMWLFDEWKDIVWDCPKRKEWPLQINRTFSKTGRDVSADGNHVVGKQLCPIPYRLAVEILRYRDILKNWKNVFPKLYHPRMHNKPPVFDHANNTFHGKIFCIRKSPDELSKDLELRSFKTYPAIWTSLRASASCNIYDFAGSKIENDILKHEESSRVAHYSPSALDQNPLSGRPQYWSAPNEKHWIVNYNNLFDIGDSYYEQVDQTNAVLNDQKERYYSQS